MALFGVVCGLKSEADVVRRVIKRTSIPEEHFSVAVTGADADRAEKMALEFLKGGRKALLSIGVSGGLDPSLKPGDVLFARTVGVGQKLILSPGHNLLPQRLARPIRGADAIIQTPADKAELYERTGAVAVDMESGGVATASERFGTPFLAIRAIADPAERALPPPAMDAVAADGATKVFSTLMKTIVRPWYFPALLKLGEESKIALSSLETALPEILQELVALELESAT
ncbi:MAG: hypothetical protein AAF720_02160 [Pseudomonadota bacterium]